MQLKKWKNNVNPGVIYNEHVLYIHNDIVKPFSFGIIQYVGHIQDMHNLIKYLPPPSRKGGEFEQADWNVRDKE